MTGEVRGSWGGNPRSPCFSVTEGGHAMAVRRTMSFREALLNLSGTVPEGGRADGVERETAGMFWPAVERSQPAREEGLWTSKVPFVPFRVAEQPGHWL